MCERSYWKFQNKNSQKDLPNLTRKVWAKGLLKVSKYKQPKGVQILHKNVL